MEEKNAIVEYCNECHIYYNKKIGHTCFPRDDPIIEEFRKTNIEFWKEWNSIKINLSPEKKSILLNEHLQHLTRWLCYDRK